jgi:hypothetical protein
MAWWKATFSVTVGGKQLLRHEGAMVANALKFVKAKIRQQASTPVRLNITGGSRHVLASLHTAGKTRCGDVKDLGLGWPANRVNVALYIYIYINGDMYLPSPGSSAPALRGRWSCLGLRTGVSPHFSMNSMREILNAITRGGGCSPSRAPWPTHKMADDCMCWLADTLHSLNTTSTSL